MKVKILPTALEDLDRGRRFYARQRSSLGDYFLDALFSDIDSLEPAIRNSMEYWTLRKGREPNGRRQTESRAFG